MKGCPERIVCRVLALLVSLFCVIPVVCAFSYEGPYWKTNIWMGFVFAANVVLFMRYSLRGKL